MPDERLELSMLLGKDFTGPLEHPFLPGRSVLMPLTPIISEKHQLPPFVTLGIFTLLKQYKQTRTPFARLRFLHSVHSFPALSP